jgi:hypothetical protein
VTGDKLVVLVFSTDQPPVSMEGVLTISGTVDVHAVFVSTEGGQDSQGRRVEMNTTYRDPDAEAEMIADILETAADQFRRSGDQQ